MRRIRLVVVLAVAFLLAFQGAALAADGAGGVIFRDTLYGAAIGGIIGSAVFLATSDDDDSGSEDFVSTVGAGVLVGSIGGLVFGFVETSAPMRSVVEVEESGDVKLAVPTLQIERSGGSTRYSASLFSMDMK